MQIHGAILSPFVRKVLVVTELKGLEYEQVMVLPGSDDEAFRRCVVCCVRCVLYVLCVYVLCLSQEQSVV